MAHQLVPEQILESAEKILFIVQGSITQFIYLHRYFSAFTKKYSTIKADLWVDETRRTRCFWKWKQLRRYGLYDWLDECPFFNKVYTKTYSVPLFKKSIKQAQGENYSVIVILTPCQPAFYIQLARKIAPQAFIAGVVKPPSWYQLRSKASMRKLNAALDITQYQERVNLSDQYAAWFQELFCLPIEQEQEFKDVIPRRWISFAKLRFLKWGLDKKSKNFGKVLFINIFGSSGKQSWTLEQALEVMSALKRSELGVDTSFIINVQSAQLQKTRKFFDRNSVNDVIIFSPEENFFQLPAIIALCDLVISVQASVIHLARALNIPTIALTISTDLGIQQYNVPGWRGLFSRNKSSKVKNIFPHQVINSVFDIANSKL